MLVEKKIDLELLRQRLFKPGRIKKRVNGCWEFQGARSNYGYGKLTIYNKQYDAHRVSYRVFKGKIPKGINVCHTCDNAPCCNPEHLFLGTTLDNTQDAMRKSRLTRKLNSKDAIQIRKLYASTRLTASAIGRRFGITACMSRLIIIGQCWYEAGGPISKIRPYAGSVHHKVKLP